MADFNTKLNYLERHLICLVIYCNRDPCVRRIRSELSVYVGRKSNMIFHKAIISDIAQNRSTTVLHKMISYSCANECA